MGNGVLDVEFPIYPIYPIYPIRPIRLICSICSICPISPYLPYRPYLPYLPYHCALHNKKKTTIWSSEILLIQAEGTGFEPADTLRYRQFSKLLV